jgi:hypothetical protein
MTHKTADITTGYETFEISIYIILYFRPSRMISGVTLLQAVLPPEV